MKSDAAFIAAACVAAAVVVAGLLLLVGVRTAQVQTGYRVHDLESEVLRLKQERASLDVERATLLRPARLAELSRTSLHLGPVDAARLVPAPHDDAHDATAHDATAHDATAQEAP